MLSGIAGVGNVLDDYAHDPLDQLVRARYDVTGGTPQRDVQYNFDGVGNRLSVDDNGAVTPYTVNDLNQYTSVAGLGLTYSTNGNLIDGPGFALTYDAQNRLLQAAAATGTVTFAYDGRNRVVRRTVTPTGEAGTSVWFVWGHAQSGHWGLLEERDSSGNLVARYVHGERIDELLRREGPEGTFFYHHDALGSTVALTDGSGALIEQYRYDVFGQPSVFDASGLPLSASAVGNRFLFTGREWLAELGLYDYRNRIYSPMLGRWLQPDPIGFAAGDVGLYRYCGNCPVRFADPMGLVRIDLDLMSKSRENDTSMRAAVNELKGLGEASFNILAHGEPKAIFDNTQNRMVRMTPEELVGILKRKDSSWKPGQPIRLWSCEAGQGLGSFAAKLSELLPNTEVFALEEIIWGEKSLAGHWFLYSAPRFPGTEPGTRVADPSKKRHIRDYESPFVGFINGKRQ